MRRLNSWLPLGLVHVVATFGVNDTVHALPDEPVVLDYQAPGGCGTPEQVLARLQTLRGSDAKLNARVKAAISVKRSTHGYDLSFRAEKDAVRSQRQLVVADCPAAVEASALLLHFTLEPELALLPAPNTTLSAENALDGAEPAPAATPTPTTDASTSTTVGTQPQTQPQPLPAPVVTPSTSNEAAHNSDVAGSANEPSDPMSLPEAPLVPKPWVGVGASVVDGVAPRWSIGASLEAGLLLGRWSLQLHAAYHPVPSVPIDVMGARLDSTLVRVHVLGGPMWGSPSLQGGPFLGLGVEHLRATPRGISAPSSGESTWSSLIAGVNLQTQLVGGVGLNLRAGALSSLGRPEFTVVGVPGLVHQPTRFGWCASLGMVWIWDTN